jgi:lactate dehydrogenase-like 2-hydroxyacid dehydrogenase
MKPLLLVLVYLSPEHRELVSQSFDMIYAPNDGLGADRSKGAAQISAHGERIQVVLTNGTNGITVDEIDEMPNLRLVCTVGVGYENVALTYATARGIRVCNAANTNDDCVADHAMALLLAAVRRIPTLNRFVREGIWRDDIPRPPHVSGRRLGILGLGAIGRQIAKRATAFDMPIGYYGRRKYDDVAFPFFDTPLALAEWADFLVVATPGGKDTFHIINGAVLTALGPQGVVVNISRGTTVDTQAVADALRDGRIFAAALDVYEGEPTPPEPLLTLDNALLTPHVGGISPQAIHASVQRFVDNATRFFAGQPLISPVN